MGVLDGVAALLTRLARSASSTRNARPSSSNNSEGPTGRVLVRPRAGAETATPTPVVRRVQDLPGPGQIPMEYDVDALGLPTFTYAPHANNRPDPGEVVWTWVPYQEDCTQGKDRPVLVLAVVAGRIVFAQLTSKDHDRDAAQEASAGRYWVDIGSGAWDSKGRASEARIDRVLCVDPGQMRREGARLDEARFTQVVAALRKLHA
ncbi:MULTISPECIES: type II toxin-antitoxin system PemK/MazF family toxin [unclassified Actinobaculum]|uniref:type II toxin-antitoxin system PemK/MazF family toxin n=1 Tax=unclassified Actinobaculum TaxID=2609299 RepID=UPI00196B44FB|nr:MULTISPECIES: type II toxin-antitoxin system PemK/MazF family toxin [unclassified Actinobaculum]